MNFNQDKSDRKLTLYMFAVIFVFTILVAFLLFLFLPNILHIFEPGLGLKSAAIVSFFVTIITFVIFAVTSGDGLLGEIQYMIGGFFTFFIIFWLMIAWIF